MRRSSAPSVNGSAIKRARFLPPLSGHLSKENSNSLPFVSLKIANSNQEATFSLSSTPTINNADNSPNTILRTNEDILNILDDEDESHEKHNPNNPSDNQPFRSPPSNAFQESAKKASKIDCVPDENGGCRSLVNCIFCRKNISNDSMLFSVLFCKRSGKKHKIWEGDGLLIVKNRSAVLKDLSGKVLDKGIGYKLKDIESIEDGSKFYVGGKECEIQSKIPEEEIMQGKFCKCSSTGEENTNSVPESPPIQTKVKSKPLSRRFCPLMSKHIEAKSTVKESDDFDENSFVLTAPSLSHQKMLNKDDQPIVPVYVDSFLAKQLRNHQKEGIDFMYKCIMGFQHDLGHGAILADEMGLGKTLQCISLVWTLLKRGPFGGAPVLKKIVIITPSSLVKNWQNEFHKWLGKTRLNIFAVNQKNTVKDYLKCLSSVLIISYEMFLRSSAMLSPIMFDLVICDEGHRIKNLNIKISNVVNCLSTPKRILLTGTPIQNDLAEFFSIVDFVNPGALGSIQYFRKTFEKPINLSRTQDCSEAEKEYGEDRSEELNSITKSFMLRRTQDVINEYLPQKTETVVFCSPSEEQQALYNQIIKSKVVADILSSNNFSASTPLVCISILRKLCNHPYLLYQTEASEDGSSSVMLNDVLEKISPRSYQLTPSSSGKMRVLESMLKSLISPSVNKEKVVIVSVFTKTLDVIEHLCKMKGYEYLRLDGSTNSSSRQEIVDRFNCSYTKYRIFLLSSKAGGVGFNLIGASRIILFDIDWNPANDLQAMARIWRDGQKKAVYVYRLLTTGTIEEKIFQRQLSKQSLSDAVLDTTSSKNLRFSNEELKDLFTFHEKTRCLTHELINCKCLSLEHILDFDEENIEKHQNAGMAELMNWNHICGPVSSDNCEDSCLADGGCDITFLFQNRVNVQKM